MSTEIGDSEQPGGTTTYCSESARYSQEQGVFSPDFWSVVEYETGEGRGGGRWAQCGFLCFSFRVRSLSLWIQILSCLFENPFFFPSLIRDKNWRSYYLVTGCINPETLDRLAPDDAGGQYDSSGGSEGRGNPEGSVCRGWVCICFLRFMFYLIWEY